MAEGKKTPVCQASKNKPRRLYKWNPSEQDLKRGQLITDCRESLDPTQSVRDRLCLWQTGNDIIPLLMLVKQDQLCESWRKSARVDSDEDSEKEGSEYGTGSVLIKDQGIKQGTK